MRAFLDICIGDVVKYNEGKGAYENGKQFYHAVGKQYGLTKPLDELNDEEREMLMDASTNDPTWTEKGRLSLTPPTDINAGRIVVELFTDIVPKTTENFKCLVTGEKGLGKGSKKPLHFKGGDVVKGDGSAGESIYGGKFNDEKAGLKLKHDAAGVLSMANSGKNSNSSQFFFTLAPAPQCDGKHVVFGKVVEGLDILQRIGRDVKYYTMGMTTELYGCNY